MEMLDTCFYHNYTLLEIHSRKLNISYEDFKKEIQLVAKHEELYDMATKMKDIYKANPKAAINFGEYGDNIAKKFGLKKDNMIGALLGCASNELVFNVLTQVRLILKTVDSSEVKSGENK